MSALLNNQLNRDELFFMLEFFCSTSEFPDMFRTLSRIFGLSGSEWSLLEVDKIDKATSTFVNSRMGVLEDLSNLESSEKVSNKSFVGYLHEMLISKSDEFKKSIEDLAVFLEKSLIKQTSDSCRVLLSLTLSECYYSLIQANEICQGTTETDIGPIKKKLKQIVENSFKLSTQLFKPYTQLYLRCLVVLVNYLIDVEKENTKASNLVESELAIILAYEEESAENVRRQEIELGNNIELLSILKGKRNMLKS